MSAIVDASLEPGRVDVVTPPPPPGGGGGAVDLFLVVHTRCADQESYGRELVAGAQRLFATDRPHVRARVYVDQARESVVLLATASGWKKWSAAHGNSAKSANLQTHFHELALTEYQRSARRWAPRVKGVLPVCTHETAFDDGTVLYWAGQ